MTLERTLYITNTFGAVVGGIILGNPVILFGCCGLILLTAYSERLDRVKQDGVVVP